MKKIKMIQKTTAEIHFSTVRLHSFSGVAGNPAASRLSIVVFLSSPPTKDETRADTINPISRIPTAPIRVPMFDPGNRLLIPRSAAVSGSPRAAPVPRCDLAQPLFGPGRLSYFLPSFIHCFLRLTSDLTGKIRNFDTSPRIHARDSLVHRAQLSFRDSHHSDRGASLPPSFIVPGCPPVRF